MYVQMCTVDDLTGEEPCRRMAQYRWEPGDDGHPVFLCNFHAEPFYPLPGTDGAAPISTAARGERKGGD